MTTRRSTNELYRNFELQFNARLARYDSLATDASLLDSTSALMSFANAAVDPIQRLSILAATFLYSIFNSNFFTDDVPKPSQCKSVAIILRQSDNKRVSNQTVRIISSSFANIHNAVD